TLVGEGAGGDAATGAAGTERAGVGVGGGATDMGASSAFSWCARSISLTRACGLITTPETKRRRGSSRPATRTMSRPVNGPRSADLYLIRRARQAGPAASPAQGTTSVVTGTSGLSIAVASTARPARLGEAGPSPGRSPSP